MPISNCEEEMPQSNCFLRVFRFVFCVAFVGLVLAAPLGTPAQDYSLQTGSPAFTTALPVELGYVNIGNGNVHLEIGLSSLPQRGAPPFTAALVYDSRIWKIGGTSSASWQPTNVANSQGGWRYIDNGVAG